MTRRQFIRSMMVRTPFIPEADYCHRRGRWPFRAEAIQAYVTAMEVADFPIWEGARHYSVHFPIGRFPGLYQESDRKSVV